MDKSILAREEQQYTFDGVAVDEIRSGLVLGLYAVAEIERVRKMAQFDAQLLGKPLPDGMPKMPGEDTVWKLANALLWLEDEPA